MSHGQPALQISAAFQHIRVDSSECGVTEGKMEEGDCSVFLISEEQIACLIIVSGESRLVIHRRKL